MYLTSAVIETLLKDYDFSKIPFTKKEFSDAILLGGRVSDTLGINSTKFSSLIKKIFPNKKPREPYLQHLLSLNSLKLCNVCNHILSLKNFGSNSTNKDGKMSACKPCHNKQQSNYYYTAPEVQNARVRARERKLDNYLNSSELALVFSKYNNKCAICGYTNEDHNIDYGQNLHLDHIIPFSKGGLTVIDNIQLLCKPCNSSKGNRTF